MFNTIRTQIRSLVDAMNRAAAEHHRRMTEAGYSYCQTCGNPNKTSGESSCRRCGYCGCCL